jgi:hypothetical protein
MQAVGSGERSESHHEILGEFVWLADQRGVSVPIDTPYIQERISPEPVRPIVDKASDLCLTRHCKEQNNG